jgi:hypothetical protein
MLLIICQYGNPSDTTVSQLKIRMHHSSELFSLSFLYIFLYILFQLNENSVGQLPSASNKRRYLENLLARYMSTHLVDILPKF